MNGRSQAAQRIWRARRPRSTGDRLFLAYMIMMVALVVVAPILRAIWLSATSAAGIALLASPVAPAVAVLVTAVLWASALLLGRDRGPALLPPFLAHALGTSDLSRSDLLRLPLLRAGAIVTAVTTSAATLVGGSLASQGIIGALALGVFVLTGVLVGVIAAVAWLAGQALPRVAVPIALGVLVLGVLAAFVPAVQPFTPWGWVGLAYPSSGGPTPAVVGLVILAAGLVALVPVLLNRLHLAELIAQAARWESASTFAASLDLSTAAAAYRQRPRLGRRLRAVRAGRPLWATFLVRDAIGALRTPGRLVVGALALAAAGTLLALAFAPAAPGWLLGALAGLLAFAGLGPLTDGIRHAASVASDLPLYGIGDAHLLAGHALFPLVVLVVVLLAAVTVCAVVVGVASLSPALGSLALGVVALLARIDDALKGPMPPALLTPVPTPAGDLGAAARAAWSVDGVLLAAGASAALAAGSPILLIVTAAILVGVGVNRWRHRR